MLQFNKALYVSRQKTQEFCLDVINKGHYLDIYGMTGLGKTEFLKWIHDNQKQHDTTFCCYVDLQSNNININNAIAEQLYDETIFPDDPFADFKQFSAQDEDLHNAFNNGLQTVLNSYKVVLCIDNTDSATSTWQTFEEKVLEYHNEYSSNLIIITAGQKPIQLAPRLRLRLQSLPLPYLTETQVQNQIQRLGIQVEENVVPEIFRLTQGHPLSVRLLVDLWSNDLNLKTIQQQLAHGINKLMSEVIEKTILNQLQLGTNYPEPKILLQYIVPLRYILRQTQRFMLAKFLPDYFANKPPIFADRLFTEFQKINLFDWKEGIGHTLNPLVRQLLLEEMRNNAKNEFIKIQTTLVEMYDNLTRENNGESQYFIEKVYHSAVLLTETASNIDSLAGEMQSYLDTYFVSVALLTETDQKIIGKLRNTLKADTELNQLIEVDALLRVIDEFVTITPTEDEEEIKEEVKEEIIQPILPLVERIEITQFDNALQPASPIRILAIDTEGQGGVGKTIFLLQMQERCISRPNEIVYSKELIDFFQLENRNKTGVMEQIAKHLELKTFLSIVKQFRTTSDVAEREKLSSELPTIFLQGYEKVAKRLHQESKLLVLFFDSYEYIQSTTERKADTTNFSHWLETELFVQLAHPENARLVIAGRYQPIELSRACSERILLSPFSFENTKEFLQRAFDCATEEQLVRHIAPIKVIEKFHQLAQAQPIFIALFVDWINSSNSSPEELLTEIENQTGEVSFPLIKNQRQFFEKKLIDNIYQLLETSQLIVTYLAVAYRVLTKINAVITKYQRDSRWQHSEIQGQFLLSKGKAEFALAKYDSAIQAFTLAKEIFFDTGEDHWANWAITHCSIINWAMNMMPLNPLC
ncbi:hypothetical protein PN36_25565 [Candidatus Thiomargarita nelsonii]|uniref:Uncharacterized protein n=1 Tax=Candidatus Thiomargarita nelsonii TaxID=1003181 RepID=A0A0A6P8V1_9GAMM|nr:hypothetical protein PN36_25565 [Candidatus Thiomargarita nelsonii]